MLFIRSIMTLDDDNITKVIFIERATKFFMDENDLSEEWSIVADLLRTAEIFKLTDEIKNMVERGQYYSKQAWKVMVWDRGWALEDALWCLEARLYKELDLFLKVSQGTLYLTWWTLSNMYPDLIHVCENLSRILCHASLLKCDDIRLKSLPPVNRVCSLCDHYAIEDGPHIIMQCPGTQHLRNDMFEELESSEDIRNVFAINENDVMLVCLGKCPNGILDNVMVNLWCISGRHINQIYKYVLSQRRGIG